jgi:hypothetical protein
MLSIVNSLSLSCVFITNQKDSLTTLLQRRAYKTYSAVGCNTNCSQTPKVPRGSRPHGHDRSLVLCLNDPACWQSTPTSSQPSDRTRTLVSWLETYGDTPSVEGPNGQPRSTCRVLQVYFQSTGACARHDTSGGLSLVFLPVKPQTSATLHGI